MTNSGNYQKGIAHLLLLIVLLVGMVAAVWLIKNPQVFRSRASNDPIVFKNTDGTSLPLETIDGQTMPVSNFLQLRVDLEAPPAPN